MVLGRSHWPGSDADQDGDSPAFEVGIIGCIFTLISFYYYFIIFI